MRNNNIHDYSDIIKQSYQKSKRHPSMSKEKRAAQFMPFYALAGHKEKVQELERITENKKELAEDELMLLDYQLTQVSMALKKYVKVIYFQKDQTQSGGKYLEYTGYLQKIDEYQKVVIFEDKKRIAIDDIYQIDILF